MSIAQLTMTHVLDHYGIRNESNRIPCPFHKGQDNNFVYKDKHFRCYVCNAGEKGSTVITRDGAQVQSSGSSPINFIQDYEGISVAQAYNVASQILGHKIEVYETPKEFQDNKDKHAQYRLALSEDDISMDILIGRVKDPELVDTFRCGVNEKKQLVFPIVNQYGEHLSAIYQNVDGQTPKYVHERNTDRFNKSMSFFGLFQAYEKLSEGVYLVEGVHDCISMHRIGFTNTMALMGLSLSQQQLSIIKTYTLDITLFLDRDQSGIIATGTLAKFLVQNGFNVYVISLPDSLHGKDPDELIKNYISAREIILQHRVNLVAQLTSKLLTQFLMSKGELVIQYTRELQSLFPNATGQPAMTIKRVGGLLV